MKPSDQILKAKIKLQKTSPFFAYLVANLKIIEKEEAGSMGVDNKGNCYYSPSFVGGLTNNEIEGVLCFPKGTLINGDNIKPIENIKIGDNIVNIDGGKEKVTKLFNRKINEDIIKINAGYVLPLSATKEHPFYVKKYSKTATTKRENRSLEKQFKNIKPQWINASDLKKGDLIAIPKIKGSSDDKKIDLSYYIKQRQKQKYTHLIKDFKLNEDVAFLMGLYIADGSSGKGGNIDFSLNNYSKNHLFSKIDQIVKNNFKIKHISIRQVENSKAKVFSFNSKLLANYFKDTFGENAHTKHIPNFILYNKNIKILKSFLDGYISGDGCLYKSKIQFASVSKKLIQDLQLAYGRLGILTNNYLYERKGLYHNLNGRDLKDLKIYQGYYHLEKSKKKANYLEDENYFWVKIKKTKKELYCGDVFNFETATTHTYCAENIVVHNCHEVMHIVLEHLVRGKNIEYQKLLNVAMDMCVNDLLLENDFKLPSCDGGALLPRYHSCSFMGVKIDNIDKKTAIQIYHELLKKLEEKGKLKKIKVVGSKYEGGFDKHICDEKGKEKNEVIQAQKEKWKDVLGEASAFARNKGDLPKGLELMIDDLLNEKVDWRTLLYKYITKTLPFDYTYARPSKKSVSCGVYMPSVLRESVEIVVSIDTSESISKKELTDFMSEINAIAKSFQNLNMKLIVCDSDIKDVYEIGNGHDDEISKLILRGGGGTSHKPVYEYVKQNLPNTQFLINFTDAYTEFPDEEEVKTLWVLCENACRDENIPFGEIIRLV